MAEADDVVPADAITPGGWFRKQQGTHRYQRITDTSAKQVGLDVREHIYATGNGNIIAVKRNVRVVALHNIRGENGCQEKHGDGTVDDGTA
jgi:hypothetical protein